MNSLEYYEQNALSFFERTVQADVSSLYEKFLPHLFPGARILDAGCGSGRDTFYFKGRGFDVVACDGSSEMVKLSSQLVGTQTLHLRFEDLLFKEEFDAIWASASLLHIPYSELPLILQKLHRALKASGIFYASFKYGCGQRDAEGRSFYDMDEETILPYLHGLFEPLDIWKTPDTRSLVAPSPSKAWLNLLGKKDLN